MEYYGDKILWPYIFSFMMIKLTLDGYLFYVFHDGKYKEMLTRFTKNLRLYGSIIPMIIKLWNERIYRKQNPSAACRNEMWVCISFPAMRNIPTARRSGIPWRLQRYKLESRNWKVKSEGWELESGKWKVEIGMWWMTCGTIGIGKWTIKSEEWQWYTWECKETI